MEQKNIPGFDALGFRVAVDARDQFEYLLKSLWGGSTNYPTETGDCGAMSDDYYRVWTHISPQGINHILEVPGVPGLVGRIDAYFDSNLVKAWFWDPNDPEATEPLFPLCFRCALPWFLDSADCADQTVPVSITVISQQAAFFDNEEALKEHPDLGRFAAESIVPTGLFVEKGESPGPGILVVGKVLLAVKAENSLTNDESHVLRVRTLGGEVWVALPLEAITADVTGKIVAVQGSASGSFPDWIPEPLLDEPEPEPFDLDAKAIESNLRQRCMAFFEGVGFQKYLAEIHCDTFTRVLAGIFGIVSKTARQMPKDRGKITPELERRYQQAARTAPIVFARIIMANTMLLYSGKSSPALVVVAFGEGADEAMDKARKVLARIHFGKGENAQERELAKTIEDETYRFGTRRRLPEWLVGNVEAYAADLWVPGSAAHEGGLSSEVLVCLAEPGPNGLTAAIPAQLVEAAIDSAKEASN